MNIKLYLTILFAKSCLALNFEAALSSGQFVDLSRHRQLTEVNLSYGSTSKSSLAFMLAGGGGDGNKRNYSLTVGIADVDCSAQDNVPTSFPFLSYNLELSLAIIKLERQRNKDLNRLTVTVADGDGSDPVKYVVTRDRPDPGEKLMQRRQHLFKTWPFDDYDISTTPPEDACAKSISVQLLEWQPSSSLFFVTTLHKRMRRPFTRSDWTRGCPGSSDFGCNVGGGRMGEGHHQICIPGDVLTCDFLPNCAQETLPNTDEQACGKMPLERGMRLLLLGLSCLVTLLVVIACCRSCYLHSSCCRVLTARIFCLPPPRSNNSSNSIRDSHGLTRQSTALSDRRQALVRYLSDSLPRRPANAPPTYDDAVKNDNRGYVADAEEERPPSYREIPDDEYCNYSVDEDGDANSIPPHSVVEVHRQTGESDDEEHVEVSDVVCDDKVVSELQEEVSVDVQEDGGSEGRGEVCTVEREEELQRHSLP